MHAGRKSKGVGVKHRVVRVEEVVVAHAIVGMASVVGRQSCWARKGWVLRGRHRWWHVVRRREVLLRERARASGVLAWVVVVVGVGLFLVLLLCNTKSA